MTETVLYNGKCPICAAEIAQYRAQAIAADAPLDFVDLHEAALDDWGISPDQAARRLHLRKGGQVISGFPAFLAIWQELPRLRWLARVLSLPGLRHLAGWGYERIAAPILYRLHLRRRRGR
ncbi:MAG: DUF393 domain-containing protein [Rhodobacteraceae bacterium]|nr:DUF393 domain-containing protein [Paracoccaceae bacterium]